MTSVGSQRHRKKDNTAFTFTHAGTAQIHLTKRNVFYPEDVGGLFIRGFYINPRIYIMLDSEN